MLYLAILPILGFGLAALWLLTRPVPRGGLALRFPEGLALLGLAVSVLGGGLLALRGPLTLSTAGLGDLGPEVRVDVVSVAMAATVSLVGWVVLRFARRALDGEGRHAAFMGWMSVTLAGVLLLVSAGNLLHLLAGWLIMSLALNQLILFYPDRPLARRAAMKKRLITVAATLALVAAMALLWLTFGTADLAAIAQAAAGAPSSGMLTLAAGLILIVAIMASALIPFQGWLTEVMEAPTPVSALLHAGIINAGGFLLIRFADVMLAAPGVLAVAALLGGFSALCAAAIALTQPSVKGALVWSTCAQMGFMVLQCGLALFPLALLHIVAHSLYKSHAFLSAGSAVQTVAAIRRPGPVAVPDVGAVARAFGLSVVVFLGVGSLFGLFQKPPQEAALGAILIFGVAYLIAQGLADLAPRALTQRTLAMSLAATLSYFTLQWVMKTVSAGTLPPPPSPDGLMWATILLALASFGLAAFAQATFALWARHPAVTGMRVHLLNGLYINALTDRITGRWQPRKG